MADKTITLDIKTDKKKIDDLIEYLKKSQKIPIELTPNDAKLKTSVGDFRKQVEALSGKQVEINTTIPEITEDVKELKTELQTRIDLAIDTQKSATSVREFKKAQKELQGLLLEIGDDGSKDFEKVAIAIGGGNDKLDELNDKIKSLSKAPIENLSAGFKGVKDSLLDLNFEEFNDRVKNLGVVSKQVSFKDLNKSLAETGKSFLSLGKLIATNPFGLLITAVGLVVANFDKLKEVFGPIISQLQVVGDVLGFVTDGFFALTDAIGLTTVAENKAREAIIKTNEEREKRILSSLAAQEAYYAATKDLTEEEIADIERRTGVIIQNERSIFEQRQTAAEQVKENARKELDALEALEFRKGELNEEEKKRRDELVEKVRTSNADIVKAEADRINLQKQLALEAQKTLTNLDIQSTSDKSERARKQAEIDKIERDKQINDTIKDVSDRDKALKNSELIYQNSLKDIRKQSSEDARNESQRIATQRLKDIQDEQQVIINATKEGSAERLAEEIKLSQKTEEFIKSKGRQLGLTENEITLKIQEEVKKRTELEERYNTEIIRLSNEKNLAQRNIDVLEAKTLEEKIKANTALIEEGARQEIEALRRTITDKELLTLKEREITLKKNEDIRQSNLQLKTEEETTIIETGLLRIQNDIKAVEGLKQSTDQRIEQVNRLFDAEMEALDKKEKLEIEAAEGNETKINEIRERYRGLRLDAEKKLEDDIADIRAEALKKLEKAVEGLNDFIQNINPLTTELGASINNLVGGIANSIPNLFKVINDEASTWKEKTLAYLEVASAAVSGIGQVLSELSNQRLGEIQTEEERAIAASENEYNARVQYINQNVADESQRKRQLEELEKGRASANDNLRKKYAAIELAEKKKAFNQQKSISLVQAAIATAQGVVSALTMPPPASFILAALTGALGAVQIGLIASKKFPEGGSGGGGGDVGNISIPSSATSTGGGAPSPTPFQAPQFFGIGQQQQGQAQPPQPIIIENNIVETDITSTQRNINAIETRASIV